MGYKDIRGTAPLEKIIRNNEKKIGVVSLTGGSGASFICSLLSREKINSENKIRIIDLGEERGGEEIQNILVVADCRTEINKNFPKMISHLRKRGVDFGLVLNRYSKENDNEELAELCRNLDSKIPVFKVPDLETERFTDLYNYVFYS